MRAPTLERRRVVAHLGPVDPRFDARLRAVRRRHSRRRTLLLAAAGAVVALGASAWPLLHSHFFSAAVIRVAGNQHTSTDAVLRAAGLESHPPLIDVHPGSAAAAIEALPWVERAEVQVEWPDGVAVRVTERRAVAAAAAGARWAVLDGTGRVLEVDDAPPAGLVRLTSAGTPGAPGSQLRGAAPSLRVAAALPVAFRSMVTAVSPSPGGGVDLALSDGIGVVLGPPNQLPSKFEDVASLLAGAGLASGSVIDVTVPASPAVTPPHPPGAPSG